MTDFDDGGQGEIVGSAPADWPHHAAGDALAVHIMADSRRPFGRVTYAGRELTPVRPPLWRRLWAWLRGLPMEMMFFSVEGWEPSDRAAYAAFVRGGEDEYEPTIYELAGELRECGLRACEDFGTVPRREHPMLAMARGGWPR